MTFTIRLAILPLTFKGVKSMQRLQSLQPEMKRLQERYKDDKQRMNQELMKFYQEQKVNPLGSCLPLLLQIPFFMALFVSGLQDDEFARTSRSPGRPEASSSSRTSPSKLTDNIPVLAIMVVLYIGTQLASTAVTAISADPTQRKIMFALPFVFTIFIINFPAGLLLYWITTNTWTIGQQLLVRKLYPKPEPIESPTTTNPRPRAGKPPAREGRVRPTARTARRPSSRPPASAPSAAKAASSGQRRQGRRRGRRPPSRRPRRARSASAPGGGGSGGLRRPAPGGRGADPRAGRHGL